MAAAASFEELQAEFKKDLEQKVQSLQQSLAEAHHRAILSKNQEIDQLHDQLAAASTWAEVQVPNTAPEVTAINMFDSVESPDKFVVAEVDMEHENEDEAETADSVPTANVPKRITWKSAAKKARFNQNLDKFKKAISYDLRASWDMEDHELHRLRIRARHNSIAIQEQVACHDRIKRVSSRAGRTNLDAWVLHPETPFRMAWNIVAVGLLMYTVVTVPLEVFAPEPTTFSIFMEWLNIWYWTSDIGISFFSGFNKNFDTEMRFKVIWRNYLRTWFPFDIFVVIAEWCLVIMDLVLAATAPGSGSVGLARTLRAARILRVVRYLRLVRLIRVLKLQGFAEALKERTNSEYILIGIALGKVSSLIGFGAHASACIWFFVGNTEGGWVYVMGVQNAGLSHKYWSSFQWSLSRLHPTNVNKIFELSTAGERFFSVCATFIALGVSSIFVSIVTNKMAEMKRQRYHRSSKLELIRELAFKHCLSTALVFRLKHFITTKYIRQLHSGKEAEFLELLPVKLLQELKYEVWGPLIKDQEIFSVLRNASGHARTEIQVCHRAITEVTAYKDDTLFEPSDTPTMMFMINSGSLFYVGPDRRDNLDLEVGLVFGDTICEVVLWISNWSNKGHLRALELSILAGVVAEDFEKVVHENPAALLNVAQYARDFLVRMQHNADNLTDLSPPESGEVTNTVFTLPSGTQSTLRHGLSTPTTDRQGLATPTVDRRRIGTPGGTPTPPGLAPTLRSAAINDEVQVLTIGNS